MIYIRIPVDTTGFLEDKVNAKRLRLEKIVPALEQGEEVVLDFVDVRSATQSYIHALIGEPLVRFRERLLDSIEFKNCSRPVKSIIEFVVDYSLEGFQEAV